MNDWEYKYKYKTFSGIAALTDFLNEKDIPYDDIVSITTTNSPFDPFQLIYLGEEDND